MKILISGSRFWSTKEHVKKIYNELYQLPKDTILVHGNAKGVDTIAKKIAEKLFDKNPISYPANWKKYRNSAGPIRNREMYENEKPFDLILVFHDDIISTSKGSKDMLLYSLKEKNKVKLIT